MGLLKVDTLEPEGATTTLTVGESGQNTVLPGNIIKFNTLKDAGGNTLFVSDGAGALSSCLLYTSPSPRDGLLSRMPSSA